MTRIIVFVVSVMALLGALSSVAGAVTWTNTGDTTFTATGGLSTLSVTGVIVALPNAVMTGRTGTAPFVGTTWTAITGTWSTATFRLMLVPMTVDCRWQLTAELLTVGVTRGNVDLTCGLTVAGGGPEVCRIEGQIPATYANPAGGSFGTLTMTHTSSLRTTNASTGACLFGASDLATLTTNSFRVTSATGGPSAPHTGPVFSTDG